MTISETTPSPEKKTLAKMAQHNKTPVTRAVIEYVESFLNISPKSPQIFGAISKTSDTVNNLVPRTELSDGTLQSIANNSYAANDSVISDKAA